ncbi:substrate-binding domain-containing protein [Actinomadura keratinilytica]|uniref:Uncharacterized protein n=1 Tax=Actinomadura keratinilytica TaxID=547461 RepID=A0ABP7Z4D7_9ACTN
MPPSHPSAVRREIADAFQKYRNGIREAIDRFPEWVQALAFLFVLVVMTFVFLGDVALRIARGAVALLRRVVHKPSLSFLRPVLRVLVGAAVLAATALAGWHGTRWFATRDWCDPPQTLRVLSGADLQLALQAQADRFMAEQRRKGCAVEVTVYSAPSFEEIESSLEKNPPWRPDSLSDPLILGPHPDVLVLGSSAQLEDLEPGSSEVTLSSEGPLAVSRIGLAVPAPYAERIKSDSRKHRLTDLVKAANAVGLTVARPDPERSEGALLATQALYRQSDPRAQEAAVTPPPI